MTARLFVLALATIICLGETGNAATEHTNSATTQRRQISGGITAEVPDFIPVGQHGCKVLLFHPGFHHTTGSLEGSFVEDGYFLIDRCTGEGFYYVTAVFTGAHVEHFGADVLGLIGHALEMPRNHHQGVE